MHMQEKTENRKLQNSRQKRELAEAAKATMRTEE